MFALVTSFKGEAYNTLVFFLVVSFMAVNVVVKCIDSMTVVSSVGFLLVIQRLVVT